MGQIKKFIFITQDYLPSADGITTWVYELALQLKQKGFPVFIITKTYDGFQGKTDNFAKEDFGLDIMRLSHERWKNNRNAKIYKAIKPLIEKGTIFICANWLMAVPCYLHSLTKKIDYFITYHGLDVFEDRKIHKFFQKKSTLNAAGVTAVSSYTAGLLEPLEINTKSRLKVINHGVDISRFYKKERNPGIEKKYSFLSGPKILSLGRLIKRKGFDFTIQAMSEIKNSEAHYYIAGKGKDEIMLKNLVSEMNLEQKVHFIGFVENEDLAEVYNCADIYAMPSRQLPGDVEGLGLTYLEAGCCGVPGIGGKGCGAEDAVIHGETGLLVDSNSPSEIAKAIDHLLDNKDERISMGNAAIKNVRENFSWEAVGNNFLNFFKEQVEN